MSKAKMDPHVCSATCSNIEHVRSEDVNDTDIILLNASDVGYSDVLVETTHRDIMKMVNEPLNDCKKIMPRVAKALRNKNTNKMFAEKGKEWKDFCNDVAIYYVCRFKIYGTLIPIVKMTVEHDLD
jgi:hypothetical protein